MAASQEGNGEQKKRSSVSKTDSTTGDTPSLEGTSSTHVS